MKIYQIFRKALSTDYEVKSEWELRTKKEATEVWKNIIAEAEKELSKKGVDWQVYGRPDSNRVSLYSGTIMLYDFKRAIIGEDKETLDN